MSWSRVVEESAVAEPGAVVPVRWQERGVVVTRDVSGDVHVLRNVCPHQAATVCREPAQDQEGLECPNHYWMFGLDGTFRGSRIALQLGRTVRPDPARDLPAYPSRVREGWVEADPGAC